MRSTLDEFANRIRSKWQNLVPAILDTAALCAEADQRFKRQHQKKLLLGKLPFSASVFSMLVQIGRDPRLRQDAIMQLLPPNYSTIYRVTQFNDEQLGLAVRSKVLHPTVKRNAVDQWLAKQKAKRTKQRLNLPKELYAGIRFPEQPSTDQINALENLLNQIVQTTGADVLRHSHQVKGMGKWQRQVEGFIRKKVRERVWQMKRRKGKIAFPLDKSAPYGFLADEIDVPVDADEEKLRSVLSVMGCDATDYDEFFKEAVEKYPMPVPNDAADEQCKSEQDWEQVRKGFANARNRAIDRGKFKIFE